MAHQHFLSSCGNVKPKLFLGQRIPFMRYAFAVFPLCNSLALLGRVELPTAPRPSFLPSIRLFSKPNFGRFAQAIPPLAHYDLAIIVHLVQGFLNLPLRQAKFLRHHFSVRSRNYSKVCLQRVPHVSRTSKPIARATATRTS